MSSFRRILPLFLLAASAFAQSVSINGVPNQTFVGPSGSPQYIAPQAIAGCGVEYVSGLTYTVGACNYSINGVTYNSPLSNITLPAADATNPEIDVIYVDTTGVVQVIQGTPAVTPQQPVVDPSTQLQLTFVLVPATATTPANTTSVLIYDEGTEWTSAKGGTSSANVNLTSTNNPYHGTKDTEFGSGGTVATTTYAQYTKPAAGTVTLGNYNTLTLYLRNKAAWPKTRSVTVQWHNGTTPLGTAVVLSNGAYGLDATGNITSYQQISIPASTFGIAGTAATTVRFTVSGSGSNLTGFYLDQVSLQGGSGGVLLPSTLMNYRGAWSSTATYQPNDTVVSGGIGYVALVTNTGVSVTTTATWTPLASSGSSSAAPIGAVQIAGAAGAFAAGVGDINYQSPNSTPTGGAQGSLQVVANAVVDLNQFSFTDGTTGWSAGPAYVSYGVFAEDFTYTALMNPSKFTAAQILNVATKLAAATDAHGVIAPAVAPSGAIGLQYSGLDANHAFTTGPGASMVGLLCYVHFLKTGTTTCYTANVTALKVSQAYRPLNGSSHLPTVVIGANEYIPGSLFLEQMRFSGDIANASVLLAAYDAAMLKMATAAGDAANVAFFTTNLSQVTTSIQAEFIDGTSHMLLGSTGVDNQIDVLSSGMAVWFSQYLNTPILTLAQQKAIGTFLHTNLATITHNGYFANVVTSGGAVTSWTTQGTIPSGGGPTYTSACSGSTTTYQNGYWSLVTGMAAEALSLTNPSDIPSLLASFRDSQGTGGGDPGQEYYTQAFGTNSGACGTATTPNMESAQSVAWAAANLIGPTALPAGVAVVNQYGGLNNHGGNLANGEVADLTNTNVAGTSGFNFVSTLGVGHTGSVGQANPSYSLYSVLAGKTYLSADNSTLCLNANNLARGAASFCDLEVNASTGATKVSGLVDSALTAGTSPICPNGTGGALTTTGCTGGGGSAGLVNLCSVVTLSAGATCSSGVISIASGTTSFTISAIPGTYVNLEITYNLNGLSGAANLIQQFNGTGSYTYQQAHLSTTYAGFQGAFAYIGGVAPSGVSGVTAITIPFYATGVAKQATSYGGNAGSGTTISDMFTESSNVTAAITSLTYSLTAGNFGAGAMTIYATN